MNHWSLIVQFGVGGIGALLFLNALANSFAHEEKLFHARKLEWDLKQMKGETEDEVFDATPVQDVLPVAPSN